MFSLSTKSCASILECSELHFEGIDTQKIFSLPNAAVAMTETNAESIPPLSPIKADLNPHFLA